MVDIRQRKRGLQALGRRFNINSNSSRSTWLHAACIILIGQILQRWLRSIWILNTHQLWGQVRIIIGSQLKRYLLIKHNSKASCILSPGMRWDKYRAGTRLCLLTKRFLTIHTLPARNKEKRLERRACKLMHSLSNLLRLRWHQLNKSKRLPWRSDIPLPLTPRWNHIMNKPKV